MNKPFVPEKLVAAAVPAGPARFTADEFLHMSGLGSFDGMKVELSHGELVRMNPPHRPHGAMQAQLIIKLHAAIGSEGLLGEVAVRLGETTVRGFDVGVVEPNPRERVLDPDEVKLVIEVADTSLDYDLGTKARDYAEAGIPLVWVVDVNARVIHVMRDPEPEGYSKREVVRFGEPLVLPGGQGSITLD